MQQRYTRSHMVTCVISVPGQRSTVNAPASSTRSKSSWRGPVRDRSTTGGADASCGGDAGGTSADACKLPPWPVRSNRRPCRVNHGCWWTMYLVAAQESAHRHVGKAHAHYIHNTAHTDVRNVDHTDVRFPRQRAATGQCAYPAAGHRRHDWAGGWLHGAGTPHDSTVTSPHTSRKDVNGPVLVKHALQGGGQTLRALRRCPV